MGGTHEGARKIRQKMIDQYGSYEAYRDHMREIGILGGKDLASSQRAAITKLKKDPDYFKKLSRKAVEAKRLKNAHQK